MRYPIATWVEGELFKATSTPDGPATVALKRVEGGVAARAWGPGADWVLEQAPAWVGALDEPQGFEPTHPVLVEQHRRHQGLRLGHTGRVFDALVWVILGQKVTTRGANLSRRALYATFGEPAPGPVALLLPPDPRKLARVPYCRLHPMNIERRRATFLIEAARAAPRLEEAVHMGIVQARQRLQAVRGIGIWTTGLVGAVALGDPDGVAVGDYHLKNTVSWLLAGEPRATDERMLELLEPYRGHQRRVIALLGRTGQKAPRYGARLAVNDIRDR